MVDETNPVTIKGKELPNSDQKTSLSASLRSRLNNFTYPFRNKKRIINTILSVLVLAGSVGVGAYLVQQRQATRTKATGVELSLSPTNTSPQIGETFTVAVGINAQGANVSAADVRITYDATKLEATAIQAGNFLPTVLMPGQISGGTVAIVLGCLVDQTGAHPQTGTGYLAQITFKAKAAGASNIAFDSATAVAAVGQTTNAVGVMTPTTIDVGGATASPTATATATTQASPTASPTTTASPTASPSGSPGSVVGDLTGDGRVTAIDLGILLDNYSKSPLLNPNADLTGDGRVTAIDLGILLDNYGK